MYHRDEREREREREDIREEVKNRERGSNLLLSISLLAFNGLLL